MTGGVVLFAKGAAYQHATALFLERRVEKRYWALTQGRVASGIYTHYLEKCAGGMVRAAKTRSPRGRTAVAEFKTRLAQGDLALVRCLPHTGRPISCGCSSAPWDIPSWGTTDMGTGSSTGHMAPGIKPFGPIP